MFDPVRMTVGGCSGRRLLNAPDDRLNARPANGGAPDGYVREYTRSSPENTSADGPSNARIVSKSNATVSKDRRSATGVNEV
jgi:hypothetical protein